MTRCLAGLILALEFENAAFIVEGAENGAWAADVTQARPQSGLGGLV
jgi:hypothetical protein